MSEEVESMEEVAVKEHERCSAFMAAQVDRVVLVALDKDMAALKRRRNELLTHIRHLEAENADLRQGYGKQ